MVGAIKGRAYAQPCLNHLWWEGAKTGDFSSGLIASLLISITDLAFLLSSDRFDHWFLIPIGFCGALVGRDAIEWFRGRLALYDPVGLLGVFGVHFFFLAPLLHVKWDFWMSEVSSPPDWRDWLGYMGILNGVGLVLYRICRRASKPGVNAHWMFWDIDKTKFLVFLPVCILASTAAQAWFYSRVGGIVGYMQAHMDTSSQSAFYGMGWFFMISESAPILVALFLVLLLRARKISWSLLAIALLALFTLQMYFGGLRGSRSETVQLLFWVVGGIHFLVCPIPRKLIYVGCVFLAVFMYFYGFYKALGKDAAAAFAGSEERTQLVLRTGRTSEALVLGDLGRADVQAFVLYRLMTDGRDFNYAKGRTYLGAISLWVPRWVLSDRPETKLREGTEIQAGSGGYAPEAVSSRVYGLAGESMLNFGPLSVPFAYALFGFLVGGFRNGVSRLLPGDVRLFLVPFGVYCSLTALLGDSDNLTFGLAKNLFVPFLLLVVCSVRRKQFAPYSAAARCRRMLFPGRLNCD
jgi:hypothetical protein